MRTRFLALCLAVGWAASAYAQDVAPANTQGDEEVDPKWCLMKSDSKAWDAAGLSATKRSKANVIVEHINKDHKAKTQDARTLTEGEEEEMNKYVKELEDLLSPAEFSRWQDWCADQDFEKEKEGSK